MGGKRKFFFFFEKIFPLFGESCTSPGRSSAPYEKKEPANSGRRYSARYRRRGSGKRSFWRAVRTRLAISFSPAGKYTNRGKWGFPQAPPACSCGPRTPEACFRQNKKTGISHKQFFSERQQDRCTAKSAIRLTPFQIPEAGGGAGPPHPGQRLYHARPMSAACPHAAREQRSKNKNVRILIYNLHLLS